MALYNEYKDNIKPGDVIVWSNYYGSLLGRIAVKIIRLFTLSEYYHVGIVISKINEELVTVDASYPKVKITLLRKKRPFYHINMDIDWNQEMEEFLLNKLGQKYSILQAIKAYFGKPDKDNKWICTELVIDFYKKFSIIDLSDGYTPSELVRNILSRKKNSSLTMVK